MEKFISFVESNKQLKELKISIYKDIYTCGWFGTSSFYERFIRLFEAMRKHYMNEHKASGDILRITTQDMRSFCQHYVNEYDSVKNSLFKLNIV